MSMNATPSSQRVHISFFGCRNAGKSSLVNAVTGQKLAVVSDVLGTTTDPVSKSMELLPLGPVVITDTPGYDDEGSLGKLRVEKTLQVLRRTDVAVLVIDGEHGLRATDRELIDLFAKHEIPYIAVWNKCDLVSPQGDFFPVSAAQNTNIGALKETIARLAKPEDKPLHLVDDLIKPGDHVLLITPIDKAAPKGRIILPQQQVLRDILDHGGICSFTRESELPRALELMREKPALAITDSQIFGIAAKAVPQNVPLTSFSILMARSKGTLTGAVNGAKTLDHLQPGDKVLISEGCTHHRQCEDIGTVKLPALLRRHVGGELDFAFTSGGEFPEDLSPFRLVIHCGGCMLNQREMHYRARHSADQNVPMTNYGIAIAHMTGILQRSIAMLPEFFGADKV